MSAAASLSEETIRERVGERSFAEGVKYARRGAVSETRRTGTTIKARCQGSQPQPYRTEPAGRRRIAQCAPQNRACPVRTRRAALVGAPASPAFRKSGPSMKRAGPPPPLDVDPHGPASAGGRHMSEATAPVRDSSR